MISLDPTPTDILKSLDDDLQKLFLVSTPGVTLTDLLLVQIAREIKKLQAPMPVRMPQETQQPRDARRR